MYGEHYFNVIFLVKILFSIKGSLFLHIPLVRFDNKNKIASQYSLQTKLSFWSSFIQQCASVNISQCLPFIKPTNIIDAQSFSNSFEGVHGVVRKSGRGSSIFVVYCIFMLHIFKVFWGGTWGAPPLLPPLPPPRLHIWPIFVSLKCPLIFCCNQLKIVFIGHR
jgi:hypothetical protein